MTTATATEVERRRGQPRKPRNLAASLSAACLAGALALGYGADANAKTWPSAQYREKPVEFFREVLGVEPWEKQIEVIEAARDNPRVAVKSGHKVSKSHTAGGVALWFYSSFDDARVVMSSTTARQVDQILWREIRMMKARAGKCTACKRDPRIAKPCVHSALIDGEIHELARSGLKADDFREIVGFTAREAEAVAGISGKNLLYILDEASGIDDAIFEAIEGNRAGGARVILFSNPTRTEGEFFEAFESKSAFYKTITISSEDTPNVRSGQILIPGLATREWVEEKKLEWGEESPLYKIRVKGEFVLKEDGKILSVHQISEAEARWYELLDTGVLQIGLDPAGPGLGGDESAFAARRGEKIVRLVTQRGLSEEAHVVHLRALVRELRRPTEPPPVVCIDREGPIGSRIFGLLRAMTDGPHPEFQVVGVRSSDRAFRQPQIYDRVRDELWANLADWIRAGGAIPEDTKLSRELHAPEWVPHVNGRLKVTPKDDLRKILERSPDRADAVALAVWQPSAIDDALLEGRAAQPAEFSSEPDYESDSRNVFDPYAGLRPFQGGR